MEDLKLGREIEEAVYFLNISVILHKRKIIFALRSYHSFFTIFYLVAMIRLALISAKV